MSLIIRDGIKYSSGTNIVELTQDQYDALTSAQKNNGNFYLISDAPSSVFSLNSMDDVSIDSNLAVGQVIAFNGTKWINSNSLINLYNKVNQYTDWVTSTTSFADACSKIGIYSGIGAVLLNLKNNVAGYADNSLNTRVDASQGPVYFMLVGKANNNYYTGILLSYFYNDTSRQPVMFTYYNGTYAVKKL